MGATEALITYRTTNKTKINKAFDERVANECNRHGEGNSYCGCICQKCEIGRWHDTPFATQDEAAQWVMDESGKWNDSAAAAAYYVAKTPTAADRTRFRRANDKVETALRAYNELASAARSSATRPAPSAAPLSCPRRGQVQRRVQERQERLRRLQERGVPLLHEAPRDGVRQGRETAQGRAHRARPEGLQGSRLRRGRNGELLMNKITATEAAEVLGHRPRHGDCVWASLTNIATGEVTWTVLYESQAKARCDECGEFATVLFRNGGPADWIYATCDVDGCFTTCCDDCCDVEEESGAITCLGCLSVGLQGSN